MQLAAEVEDELIALEAIYGERLSLKENGVQKGQAITLAYGIAGPGVALFLCCGGKYDNHQQTRRMEGQSSSASSFRTTMRLEFQQR
jgi:hypothetical protein